MIITKSGLELKELCLTSLIRCYFQKTITIKSDFIPFSVNYLYKNGYKKRKNN